MKGFRGSSGGKDSPKLNGEARQSASSLNPDVPPKTGSLSKVEKTLGRSVASLSVSAVRLGHTGSDCVCPDKSPQPPGTPNPSRRLSASGNAATEQSMMVRRALIEKEAKEARKKKVSEFVGGAGPCGAHITGDRTNRSHSP
jgi:hypothetical protein